MNSLVWHKDLFDWQGVGKFKLVFKGAIGWQAGDIQAFKVINCCRIQKAPSFYASDINVGQVKLLSDALGYLLGCDELRVLLVRHKGCDKQSNIDQSPDKLDDLQDQVLIPR